MTIFYESDPIEQVKEQLLYTGTKPASKGKELKTTSASIIFLVSTSCFLLFLSWISSKGFSEWDATTIVLTGFTLAWTLAGILGIIQLMIKRIMVAEMKKHKESLPDTMTNFNEYIDPTNMEIYNPAFQLNIYEQNELPSHSYTLNKSLTQEKNIFNLKPLRIFYFFNFYSTISLKNKILGGWGQHGILYYLGSPQDIGFKYFWKFFSLKKIINQQLLTTTAKLYEAIDNAAEKPIPARTKGNMLDNYYFGCYPSNVFYCTDLLWQKAVMLLFAKTELALIDGCDYTTERSGLQWEIGQIINHVATENFVVLINTYTDIPALGASFKSSWKKMNPGSPNNREKAGPIRFIFIQQPPSANSKGNEPGYNAVTQANSKIIAFMLQTAVK